MGQQQLILLVLATVIVGLAIVVGINAFSENSVRANSDAMVQDAVRIASDIQAWKLKPAPFGGQAAGEAKNTRSDFTGLSAETLSLIGYPTDASDVYTNLNGSYQLSLDGTSAVVTGCNTIQRNGVVLTISGITDAGIAQTSVEVGNSACTLTGTPLEDEDDA